MLPVVGFISGVRTSPELK